MLAGVIEPLRAIFFDLDDTLCDTEATTLVRFRASVQALAAVDHRWDGEHLLARLSSLPKGEPRLLQLLEELELTGTLAAQAAVEAHDAAVLAHLQAVPGVFEALGELGQRFTLGVITNGPSAWQRKKLQTLGLVPYFPIVLISEAVAWSKPDAQIFHAALAKAGCRPGQALYVGDRWEVDIQGAVAAGMRAAWITPHPASSPPGPEASFILLSVAHLPAALRARGLL